MNNAPSLITAHSLPDAENQAMGKVCEAISTNELPETRLVSTSARLGAPSAQQLMNHALGYAIQQHLPPGINDAIQHLRKGEGTPVLLIRNLPPKKSSLIITMRGIAALLDADYQKADMGDLHKIFHHYLNDRGTTEFHVDHLQRDEEGVVMSESATAFSMLGCILASPHAKTVFVPRNEKSMALIGTYPHNDQYEGVTLGGGDLVLYRNREVVHARYEPNISGERELQTLFLQDPARPGYYQERAQDGSDLLFIQTAANLLSSRSFTEKLEAAKRAKENEGKTR